MAAAAGSIMLTMKKAEVKAPMKRQPRVLFMCWSRHFDPEQCMNDTEFTVNPNEEHVLLISNLGKIPTMTVGAAHQLLIDKQQAGHFFGYSINLKQMDMTLTVGPRTPLSLLLSSGYFTIVPFVMTYDQYMLMAYMQKSEPTP